MSRKPVNIRNKKISSLISRWQQVGEEEERERRERETKVSEEEKRRREIEEWKLEEIRRGNVSQNPNLLPVGPKMTTLKNITLLGREKRK